MKTKRPPTLFKLLESSGFTLSDFMQDPVCTGIHATAPAESFDTSPDHFTPSFRDFFIGKAKGGYYATSHIHGTMRRYRCRQTYKATVGNVFGYGKTELAALRDFLANYNATPKKYNRSAP